MDRLVKINGTVNRHNTIPLYAKLKKLSHLVLFMEEASYILIISLLVGRHLYCFAIQLLTQ